MLHYLDVCLAPGAKDKFVIEYVRSVYHLFESGFLWAFCDESSCNCFHLSIKYFFLVLLAPVNNSSKVLLKA